jgi:hypothetical protein
MIRVCPYPTCILYARQFTPTFFGAKILKVGFQPASADFASEPGALGQHPVGVAPTAVRTISFSLDMLPFPRYYFDIKTIDVEI